jgi:hypothetical protein
MNRIAQGSSGATTCHVASAPAVKPGAATYPAAPAPAAQPEAAPGLPRVLRLQLPLSSSGQLRGRHVPLEGPTVYVLLK